MKNWYSPDWRKNLNIINTMLVELDEFIYTVGICTFWLFAKPLFSPRYFKYGYSGFKLCFNSERITCFSWSLNPSALLLDESLIYGTKVRIFIKISTSRSTFCILWGTPFIYIICPFYSSCSVKVNRYLN